MTPRLDPDPNPDTSFRAQSDDTITEKEIKTNVEFVNYEGKSKDPSYTWILVGKSKGQSSSKRFKCKLCNEIRSLGNGLTNIKRHFIQNHKAQDISRAYQASASSSRKSSKIQATLKTIQKEKYTKKVGIKSYEQKQFIRDCTEWIALNMIPINTTEQFGFHNLMRKIDGRYHPVSRFSISAELRKLMNEAKGHYKESMESASCIACTTDVWTAENADSYSSLTGCFIDEHWNYNTVTLACTKLTTRHTGKDLSNYLIDQSKWYNIDEKVSFVTTDGAANASKQVKLTSHDKSILLDIAEDPSYEEITQTETENSIGENSNDDGSFDDACNDSLVLIDFPDQPINDQNYHSDLHCHDNENFEISFDLEKIKMIESIIGQKDEVLLHQVNPSPGEISRLLGFSEDRSIQDSIEQLDKNTGTHSSIGNVQTPFLSSPLSATFSVGWQQIICSAHRIQLSVRKFLSHPSIVEGLCDIRKTVRYFRKSSVASTYLSKAFQGSPEFKKPLRPLLDVETRWTSTLHMIKRYLRIESLLYSAQHSMARDKIKTCGSKAGAQLNPSTKALLEGVMGILQHAHDITMLLSKGNEPTLHHMDPFTAAIISKCDKVGDEDDLKLVATELKKDILERRRKVFESLPLFEMCAQAASFLHPQYKSMAHLEKFGSNKYKYSMEDCLFCLYQISICLSKSDATNSDSTDTISNSSKDDEIDEILDGVFDKTRDQSIDDRRSLQHEMKGYEANAATKEKSPLKFWRSSHTYYPRLSVVARFVFTPPASSTESERVFSIAGHLRRKRRCSLSGETTEALVVVNKYLMLKYGRA